MSGSDERGTEDEYVIRHFEPGDLDGFLELYDRVFGGGSEEWFSWKYEDNPYLSHVPIFVVDAGGEIVGARPFLAMRMRAGDFSAVALQSTDTMVHPDHRRRGLFTRMTRRSFEYYAEREPAFTFNVPNALSRPGFLALGCEVVGDLTTYYRVQDPGSVLPSVTDGGTDAVGRIMRPLLRGYLGVRDRFFEAPPEVSVSRHVEIPAETLASLYGRRLPVEIHALRDEQFFEYRFGNPRWEYTAYTARLGGRPVAGIVTGEGIYDGQTVTNVVEVVPLVGDAERDRGLAALLARVVEDHDDADVLAVRGSAIPASLLDRTGFHSDRATPLKYVATQTTLIACPLPVDGDWRFAGRDLRDVSNWHPTFVEHNTK